MADITLYPQPGKTFNQIAAEQTIGGSYYGLALARYNGFEDGNSVPPGSVIIPEDWIGNQQAVIVGRPPVIPSNNGLPSTNQMFLYGGIALVVLALLLATSRQ